MSNAQTPLTVVFDSNDISSDIEVRTLKEKDTANTMTLVDISNGGNAEAQGCKTEAVTHAIHVRDANGKIFIGMDAIGAMHDAVGLAGYFRFGRRPGLTSGPSGFFGKSA